VAISVVLLKECNYMICRVVDVYYLLYLFCICLVGLQLSA